MVTSLNGQIKSDPFLSSEHNRNGNACQSTARTERPEVGTITHSLIAKSDRDTETDGVGKRLSKKQKNQQNGMSAAKEESQFLAWPITDSSRTGSCERGVLEPFASP